MTIKQQGGIFGRNPTFNDVEVEGTLTVNGEPISDFGTMAQQDADSVNIDGGNIDGTIIGASSTAALSATTGTFGGDVSIDVGAGNPKMLVKTAGAGNNPYVQLQASTNVFDMMGVFSASPDYWRVGFGTGGAASTEILKVFSGGDVEVENGNLVIGTSGKGIDFSATSGTGTSELFDDYEEGTWTPVVSANSGTITTYSASGKYTKIGRLVTLQFTIIITDNGTGSSAMFVDGIPFTAANSNSEGGCGREEASTGVSLAVGIRTTSQLIVNKYDGTYPGVNGYRLDCSISYTV
jgi:hypothetical protein